MTDGRARASGITPFPVEIPRETRAGDAAAADHPPPWLPGIAAEGANDGTVATVALDRLHLPEPSLRRRTSEEKLWQLAESLERTGILQPVVARPHPRIPGHYEIVAGTRRVRAAQRAGLDRIPVICRNFTAQVGLESALVENLQREGLNPLDAAEGLRRLIQEFGYSQDDLAHRLGVSRSYVANTLRLLNLPAEVQDMVREERLSAGHARALLTASHPKRLAERIITRNLSVRETERLVKAPRKAAAALEARHASAVRTSSPMLQETAEATDVSDRPSHTVEQREDGFAGVLSRLLGHEVSIVRSGSGFDVRLHFAGAAALSNFIRRLRALFDRPVESKDKAEYGAVATETLEPTTAVDTPPAKQLDPGDLEQLAEDHGFSYS